jgi:hypothetical protein
VANVGGDDLDTHLETSPAEAIVLGTLACSPEQAIQALSGKKDFLEPSAAGLEGCYNVDTALMARAMIAEGEDEMWPNYHEFASQQKHRDTRIWRRVIGILIHRKW